METLRLLGWTAVLFSVQGWLSESSAQAANNATPAYLNIGMAVLSLAVVRITLTATIRKADFVDSECSRAICRSSCLRRRARLPLQAAPEFEQLSNSSG